MTESFDQWAFVYAAYALGLGGTLAMVTHSWLAMRRAEARRDQVRGK